jgi:uncharacterized protein
LKTHVISAGSGPRKKGHALAGLLLVTALVGALLNFGIPILAHADDVPPSLLLDRAEQGDVQAQFDLGTLFYYGKGVAENPEAAFAWFKKAADKGHAAAQYAVGRMYYYGKGVEQNGKEALLWFRKSAENGSADAQFALGVMYQFGKSVEKDLKEAAKWFRSAADAGMASAQYALGAMYSLGQGVVRDAQEGYRWLQKSADQNYDPAIRTLVVIRNGGPEVEIRIQEIQTSLADVF